MPVGHERATPPRTGYRERKRRIVLFFFPCAFFPLFLANSCSRSLSLCLARGRSPFVCKAMQRFVSIDSFPSGTTRNNSKGNKLILLVLKPLFLALVSFVCPARHMRPTPPTPSPPQLRPTCSTSLSSKQPQSAQPFPPAAHPQPFPLRPQALPSSPRLTSR